MCGQSINIFKFNLEMFLYIYFYMLCVEVYWHVIYYILLFYPSILMVQLKILSDYVNLNIGTFNVKGLANDKKRKEIFYWLKGKK